MTTSNHPLNGAQVLVKSLVREGVRLVLGVPGFHSMPIFDALYDEPGIKTLAVRHEQAATFMADGYARASGQIAAALTLPGPGVTFALTGLAEAYTDSVPVLLLATQVNRADIDRSKGLLHELNRQSDIVAPVAKSSERVTEASAIPAVLHSAMQAMQTGRPRPVHVEIPRDVQLETVESMDEPVPSPSQRERPVPPTGQVERAARALCNSRRPIVYAGGGVISSEASQVLIRVAERLGAPVLTTGMGMGSIPADHPLATGVGWDASGDIRPMFTASDALLAVGTRFTEAMTRQWSLHLPPVSIQIDIDPTSINRNLPVSQGLVGDARATLTAIEDYLAAWGVDRRCLVPGELATARQAFRSELEKHAGSSLEWMKALAANLPRDTIISADMSRFWADVLALFPFYLPRTMLFPWGYGTLGYGIPSALGAKLALPERPVISLVGDGAFLYTGMELATAIKNNLNVPILVFNDNAYGIIKKQQREQYRARYMAVDLFNPDFVQLALAFGAYGERVTTPEELGKAVTKALAADKPTVIEIPWPRE